jgi:putative ABC transport system substrate-binding protein
MTLGNLMPFRQPNRRAVLAALGSAAARPLVARAQQLNKITRLAIVHPAMPITELTETGISDYSILLKELRRLGHVEGQNLTVERYSGEGRTERYAELTREVVRQRPDLIVTNSSRLVLNFKASTATIPIVGLMADPVAFGIVDSLARPGGNITGVTVDAGIEIWGKRLGLLREAFPSVSRVGFLVSREVWEGGGQGPTMRVAAQQLGISLVAPPIESPIQEPEYRRAFQRMTQEHADALIVSDQVEHNAHRRLVTELAESSRLAALYPWRGFAQVGGLMAYGINNIDMFIRAADYIDKILKGAKPGEIPIYQPTKFELAGSYHETPEA